MKISIFNLNYPKLLVEISILMFLNFVLTAQDIKVKKIKLNPKVEVNMKQLSKREKKNPFKPGILKYKDEIDPKEIYEPIADSIKHRIKTFELPLNFNFKNEKDLPLPTKMLPGLIDNGTVIPPDVAGAVGPKHLMIALNSEIQIQLKNGTVLSTVSLDNFWSNLGERNLQSFDPRVVYDPYQSRWIIIACAFRRARNSSVLIGTSETDDPTGIWNLNIIDADEDDINWFDNPNIGFNKDWIVVTGNMYSIPISRMNPSVFRGVNIFVFDKNNLYNGNEVNARLLMTDDDDIEFTLCPALTYDDTLNRIYLINVRNGNTLALHSISGPIDAPNFNRELFFPTTNLNWNMTWPANFAPQLGDESLIANGDTRIKSLIYSKGSLWCTHTIGLPAETATRSAVQFWQINPVDGEIQQLGRVDDQTGENFYAYPSIAVNSNNNVLLGFSTFSANQHASAGYAFRWNTDPTNTLRGPLNLKSGLDSYVKVDDNSINRWGDYSTTVVDPNGFQMWSLQQYAERSISESSMWGTEWFLFSSNTFFLTFLTPAFSPMTGYGSPIKNAEITVMNSNKQSTDPFEKDYENIRQNSKFTLTKTGTFTPKYNDNILFKSPNRTNEFGKINFSFNIPKLIYTYLQTEEKEFNDPSIPNQYKQSTIRFTDIPDIYFIITVYNEDNSIKEIFDSRNMENGYFKNFSNTNMGTEKQPMVIGINNPPLGN
ncbi:MAG: hypothetical protein IPQ02_00100 [Saprospiraceae bacterium]|nr:hypothetical protein [Candidatus Defluviibacterium haderslevense]